MPVCVEWLGQTAARLSVGTQRFVFHVEPDADRLYLVHGQDLLRIEKLPDGDFESDGGKGNRRPRTLLVKSPIPGLIASVGVKRHQRVEQGEILLVIEAMKMQNPVRAPGTGSIKKIFVKKGTLVEGSAALVEIEGHSR